MKTLNLVAADVRRLKLNPAQGEPYNHQAVPGTGLYVFTNLSNKEKRDNLRSLVRLLEFPPDGVEVSLVD